MSFITSSIARKFNMSITGLFLISFLLVHLAGNFALLKCDGGAAFNEYAHFMKHNPLIAAGEIVLFLGIILHVVQGIALYRQNKAARPQGYAYGDKAETKSAFSKYMAQLGMLILVLLIWHLWDFFSYKYFADLRGGVDMVSVNGVEMVDMASIVYRELNELSHVIMYTVFMIVIGLHLHHGFQSAFQSLGLNHKKYTPIIQKVGVAYAILIPLAFAIIPIYIYFAGCYGTGTCTAH